VLPGLPIEGKIGMLVTLPACLPEFDQRGKIGAIQTLAYRFVDVDGGARWKRVPGVSDQSQGKIGVQTLQATDLSMGRISALEACSRRRQL
jgi:hypothetical protein